MKCLVWMRLKNPHWIIPAVSAMNLVGDRGYPDFGSRREFGDY
ncbi:MAG: hypothetical protein R3F23_01720 [Verrucomicrobiia bacterium]